MRRFEKNGLIYHFVSRSVTCTSASGTSSLDLDPFAEDDNFSLNLQDNAALREKEAHSEVLDRVAEFCQLDTANAEAKKEILGMRLPAYNAPTKTAIVLALPWHSSSVQIIA